MMSSNDLTKKSGVLYLGVFLLIVCAVATAMMAGAKLLTDRSIAAADAAKTLAGLAVVLDGVDYDNADTIASEVIDLKNGTVKLYVAKKNGIPAAFAMLAPGSGYGGAIEGLIGFDADGAIRSFIITKHNETPGIGTKVTDRVRIKTITDVIKGTPEDPSLPGNMTLDSFKGKKPGAVKWIAADGIHFVSGATISSNAVNELAWNAAQTLNEYLQKKETK